MCNIKTAVGLQFLLTGISKEILSCVAVNGQIWSNPVKKYGWGLRLDRNVTARFFGVELLSSVNPSFHDSLITLMAETDMKRWTSIWGDIKLKLLRCDYAGSGNRFLEGEFVRQQKHHIPPIAQDEGDLVDQPNPIGHRSAFLYDSQLGVLSMESRKEAVTPGKIDQFLRKRVAGHRGFHFNPCLTKGGLERLRDGQARGVSFRVHGPTNLSLVEGSGGSIGDNLEALANNFGGPSVEVRVYWPGHERGGRLNLDAVRNLVGLGTSNEGLFDKLEVKLADEPNPIDILTEQIKSVATLDLRNDVAHNWETRRRFLRESFRHHFKTLNEIYGNGGE